MKKALHYIYGDFLRLSGGCYVAFLVQIHDADRSARVEGATSYVVCIMDDAAAVLECS